MENTDVKIIDSSELRKLLDDNSCLLVDVRTHDEFRLENIPEALHIPLDELDRQSLPTSISQKIVLQCRSGARSELGCRILLNKDPQLDVYNLEGGILAWKKAGFKTQQPKN